MTVAFVASIAITIKSAWKQFFFIDCFGIGAIGAPRTLGHDNKQVCCGGNKLMVGPMNCVSLDDSSNNNNNNNKSNDWERSRNRNKSVGVSGATTSARESSGTQLNYYSSSSGCGGSNSSTTNMNNSSGYINSSYVHTNINNNNTSTITTIRSIPKSSKGHRRLNAKTTVKSPSNKALLETDPLFHLYLICVGLITLSILAIKCLIPGMPIYTHTMIGFAFLLAIIVVSTIYTQAESRKVSIKQRLMLTLMSTCGENIENLCNYIDRLYGSFYHDQVN